MSHPPPSLCTKLGRKTQERTSVSPPTGTSKQSQLSKWKSSVSFFSFFFSQFAPEWLSSMNWEEAKKEKLTKSLFIELIVFYWLLKGNTLLFFFSSEDGFFISSINGRKTIRGLLNDPVCCAVLVSNGFYFPWMPSISKCPSEKKSFAKRKVSCYFISYWGYY